MSLIFKVALVAFLHIVFFASYPDTGPAGNYYLAVSLLLWTGFTLFLGTAVKLIKFFSGALGAVLNLAILVLMTSAIALKGLITAEKRKLSFLALQKRISRWPFPAMHSYFLFLFLMA